MILSLQITSYKQFLIAGTRERSVAKVCRCSIKINLRDNRYNLHSVTSARCRQASWMDSISNSNTNGLCNWRTVYFCSVLRYLMTATVRLFTERNLWSSGKCYTLNLLVCKLYSDSQVSLQGHLRVIRHKLIITFISYILMDILRMRDGFYCLCIFLWHFSIRLPASYFFCTYAHPHSASGERSWYLFPPKCGQQPCACCRSMQIGLVIISTLFPTSLDGSIH